MKKRPEINLLRQISKMNNKKVSIITGRRRVGKTSLIKEAFIEEHDLFISLAMMDSELQKEYVARIINDFLNEGAPNINSDWLSIFSHLAHSRFSGTLYLDEFQNLVKMSPELPNIIRTLCETENPKFNIVLCGNSQHKMKELYSDSTSPLYGIINKIIELKPFTYSELSDSLQIKNEAIIMEYSVWGGNQGYWSFREKYSSLDQSITELLLTPDGLLHEEPNKILLDDMRTSIQAVSILSLVASGSNRLTDIAMKLKKPATHYSNSLQNLLEFGYLEREIPYGETTKTTKRTKYKVADPFMNFYYRFVFPHWTDLQIGRIEEVQNKINSGFSNYVEGIFKDICKKSISNTTINGIEFGEAKNWWGINTKGDLMEIDLMVESLDGKILLVGESRWDSEVSFIKAYESIIFKAGLLPLKENQKILKCTFSKSKIIQENKIGIMLIKD